MLKKEELPACPVATTVQLIGSKWKLLIIRNLLVRPWRFNELRKDLAGISQKVLTDSLRSMEQDGIVIRRVYPEVPPRVEYSLSELGESMRPIIQAMEQWGTDYKAQIQGVVENAPFLICEALFLIPNTIENRRRYFALSGSFCFILAVSPTVWMVPEAVPFLIQEGRDCRRCNLLTSRWCLKNFE